MVGSPRWPGSLTERSFATAPEGKDRRESIRRCCRGTQIRNERIGGSHTSSVCLLHLRESVSSADEFFSSTFIYLSCEFVDSFRSSRIQRREQGPDLVVDLGIGRVVERGGDQRTEQGA